MGLFGLRLWRRGVRVVWCRGVEVMRLSLSLATFSILISISNLGEHVVRITQKSIALSPLRLLFHCRSFHSLSPGFTGL